MLSETELIRQYVRIADALRPKQELANAHAKRIADIVPGYQRFIDDLASEKLFGMILELKILHDAVIRKTNAGSGSYQGVGLEKIIFPERMVDEYNSTDSSMIERFGFTASILRGRKEDQAGYPDSIEDNFDYIKETISMCKETGLFAELRYPVKAALEKTYAESWKEFIELAVLAEEWTEDPIYFDSKGHSFKQTIDWIIANSSGNSRLMLSSPAKIYRTWDDTGIGSIITGQGKEKAEKIYYASEEILYDGKEYSGCSYFFAESAVLMNFAAFDFSPFRISIAISNQYGDNSEIAITKAPVRPIDDLYC